MWVIVMFDLPVDTKEARREYARFRKRLLANGFLALQYSVYARPCMSDESALSHRQRIGNNLPPMGQVRMLQMTDKQFARMEVFYGKGPSEVEKQPEQLSFF